MDRMPEWGAGVRSVVDDFGAGDPGKIIHYKAATATIMEKHMEAANVKYNIDGYLMQTGLNARNAEERRLLNISPLGGQVMVYYDTKNPTIVVLQPTYIMAKRKMKNVRLDKSGKQVRPKRHFVPGEGFNKKVMYFRIGAIGVGLLFLFFGARQLRAL